MKMLSGSGRRERLANTGFMPQAIALGAASSPLTRNDRVGTRPASQLHDQSRQGEPFGVFECDKANAKGLVRSYIDRPATAHIFSPGPRAAPDRGREGYAPIFVHAYDKNTPSITNTCSDDDKPGEFKPLKLSACSARGKHFPDITTHQGSLEDIARTALNELGYSWDECDIHLSAAFAAKWARQVRLNNQPIGEAATRNILKKWLSIALINGRFTHSLECLELLPRPPRAYIPRKATQPPILSMAPQIPQVATTANLGQFLIAINGFLQHQNESKLGDWIQLEPPFNVQYQQMVVELQQAYPKGQEEKLREKCSQTLSVARDGIDGSPSWTQFILFMVQYLSYLRDVDADQEKYLETYELLYGLQQKANSALAHPSLGHMMLPTVVSSAQLICRLAIGLDKQPGLIAHLRGLSTAGQGAGDGPKETLPERAAELIRQALVTCLNDRNSVLDSNGRPEGKKRGIYKIANICLKILWQCRKTRNASQIFTNIGNLSPPLASYPKRERVTYLYYLGRFWFQNSHFYRAQLALQCAYDECSARPEFTKQRRQILVYLITTNVIMGRFPSAALFQRPESAGLYERFGPIMQAIRTGNLALFRQHVNSDGPYANWFLHFRILLQLQNRCAVLVWRGLVRKTFILDGTFPPHDSKTGPFLSMPDLVTTFAHLHTLSHTAQDLSYTDPDFDGGDYDESEDNESPPTLTAIESILSSLIEQGLLRGFIVHAKQRLHLSGGRNTGASALAVGFPQPWMVIQQRAEKEQKSEHGSNADDVPGWKKAGLGAMSAGGASGGMVFNLSGARPVGVS